MSYHTKEETEDRWAAYRGKDYAQISTSKLVLNYVIAGTLTLAALSASLYFAMGKSDAQPHQPTPSQLEETVQSSTTE